MRKLSLTLLAAGTMLIAGVAAAQPAAGPRPGATWRGGMTGPAVRGPNVQMRGPNMQMRGPVRTGGGLQAGRNIRQHGGGNFGFHRWGPRPGGNWRYERMRRGGHINSYWFAPQFYIGNWGAYGFSAPGADQRWVRYYDDAYLIDGGGRIVDERYGVNWNSYGEEWEEQGGIPGYRGAWRDSDEEEYAEDEAYGDEEYAESREEHREMRGGRHGGRMMPPPPGYGPPPPGGYGPGTHVYGGGYGYGMYAYPIVIETVTTTGSSGYTEEIVEEYVETRQHRRRAHRPRCSCARPAPRQVVRRPAPRPAPVRPAPRPRPPAGERG